MKKILFTLSLIIILSLIQANFSNFTTFANNKTIYLTEVMANPPGTDTGNEWIEIYNPTNNNINIENWILRTSNKEHKFGEKIIEKKSFEILRTNDFKLTLKNSNEEITLLDPNKNIISYLEIPKASDKKSMSLVELRKGNLKKTIWMEDFSSPRISNSIFYEIEGEITKNLEISKIAEIEIDSRIILIPDNFDFNSLRKILKKGDKIKALIKFQGKDIELKKIKLMEKIKTETKKTNQNFLWIIIPILVIGFFLLTMDKIMPIKAPDNT